MVSSALHGLLNLLALTATQSLAQGVYSGGDTSGCGVSHILNGITQYRTIQSAGLSRSYGIHTPSNYSSTQQYPLIIGYHGSSSIGLFFEADTNLDSATYTGNKIVVYPNGVGGAWAGANYSKTTLDQDLTFTWDMLADIRKNYCIDSARIYATGISNGGGFVGALACNDTVGGEFAAFAPDAGAYYTDNHGPDDGCTPARDVTPILEFHGGADADVFYNGGPGVRSSPSFSRLFRPPSPILP
jgi:poly(3-hydroxybutyrate) depolymerase